MRRLPGKPREDKRALMPWALVGALVASGAIGRGEAEACQWGVAYPPGDRRVMSVATVASLLVSDGLVQSAQAGDGASRPQRFDIPAGTLGSVLAALRQATNLTILVPDEAVRAIYSPGVSGVFTVERALEQLLAGTSLSARFTGPGTVTLQFRAGTARVDVTAAAPVLVASPKYAEPLRDTPQSIDVVTSDVIADQGATTLRDAVRNVAGISLAAGEGGAQGDNLTIRGFTARNDIFIDGMRDFGSYYRDPFNVEQVQVLKGPSSVAFGRGTTGGVLNQATKVPGREEFVSGTALTGTDATLRATLDVNERVPALGDGAEFRLNLMGNTAHVAGRDEAVNRRYGIAPALVLGAGSPTRATFTYFHQAENDLPDYGIPWLFNAPAPVAQHNYYGFADTNVLRTRADIGGVKVEHQLGSHIILTNQVRYANYGRDAQISEAKTPVAITLATPLGAINVDRNQITVDSNETFLQNQFDATSHFRTGAVAHTLVAGLEVGRETSDPARTTFTGVPTTSLLTPNPKQAFAGTPAITSRVDARAATAGVYALDTVNLGEQWELMAGARWDRFAADVAQAVAPATAFARVDEKPSWRGAVVYKPKPIGSLYVDYGTSFNPSAEALSLTAATVSLPPESNRTIEGGTKWDLASGRLSVRAAVYQTQKLNAREPDPNNSLLNVLSGTQRVNGVEGEAAGRVTDRWRLMASYAFMDSALIKSVAFPAAVGSELANVPKNTFTVWNTFDLPWRLQLGGGGQYVGRRTASTTVPLDPTTGLLKAVPGYWVANAMARRALNDRVDLQVNVNNVTNEYYFDQIHPAHIVPGPGRSALVGLNFKY